MKVTELQPLPAVKMPFRLSEYKNIPKQSGCYLLTNFDEDIMYIGLTDNLFRRFQEHLDNPEKVSPTEVGKAFWFWYLEFPIEQISNLERTWLNEHISMTTQMPILNKISSPV